jgi:hypothetical protein
MAKIDHGNIMNTLPIPIAFTVLPSGCAAGISAPERSPVTLDLQTIAGQIIVRHEILTDDSESGAPVIEAIAAAE